MTEKKTKQSKKAPKKRAPKSHKSDSKEIAIVESNSIQPVNSGMDINTLIAKAIEVPGSIAVIERLIELKNQEEDRAAKREFDLRFAEMQKDYRPAIKNQSVKNKNNVVLYKFCPLENILKVYAPIISSNGFSYRWVESEKSETSKTVTCIVSGYGHREESSCRIPILPGNEFANGSQQQGISTSYGRRYSFISAFGIMIEGEDDDASSLKETKPPSTAKKEPPSLTSARLKIIEGLNLYQGKDKEEIREMCNAKSKAGEFTMMFAKEIAKKLSVEL